ncbi:energy transducer TonB [Flavicella sediminum]|uniref:energy transducer TonB n=1 Tax=Flavicella sediminum TaxID=2585141 RepID=UPI001121BFC2|nr:energy transducer TonB [Flavicella sediminum]
MKNKKYENEVFKKKFNENLESSSKMLTILGLVCALFVVYFFLELETKKEVLALADSVSLTDSDNYYSSQVFEKEVLKEKIIKTEKAQKVVELIDEIVITDEDVVDLIIDKDPVEDLPVTDHPIINEIDLPVEIVEDVAFVLVENAPVYPGCEGSQKELRDCFSKKMYKHINRKFDVGLASELGLDSGKKNIYVTFLVDKKGDVVDVISRAPHPKLKEEAERILKLLPKMTPGRQGNRDVGVRFSVPISFEVQ